MVAIHHDHTYQFRLGTRHIRASGIMCDHHPNVVHLRIIPGLVDRFLWLLRLLPAPLRDAVRAWYPEWFLPPRIVLKRQKPDWEEEFDNEKAIYRLLRPLQGTVVPVCYGEADCGEAAAATDEAGCRALVLSDVGGVALNEADAGGLEARRVEAMALESLRALAACGVAHDDPKPDNYILVGDRIVIIDFDIAYVLKTEDPEYVAASDAKGLARWYQNIHGIIGLPVSLV